MHTYVCADVVSVWAGKIGGVARECAFNIIFSYYFQLLDVVRRLDAATASGFSDGMAEGEAMALRLLINVCWTEWISNYLPIIHADCLAENSRKCRRNLKQKNECCKKVCALILSLAIVCWIQLQAILLAEPSS